jgi:hypothetical protein
MEENKPPMDQILNDAGRLAEEYITAWRACAPAAFGAIVDALGYRGDPVIEGAWKASIGLTGGTGFMSIGTCGAVAGAAMAVGLAFDYGREDIGGDMMKMFAVNNAAAEIGKRVQESYGSILCQEIQFHHWGKSFRFTHPKALMEFAAFSADEKSGFKCRKLAAAVSRWTVEYILTHHPRFSRR